MKRLTFIKGLILLAVGCKATVHTPRYEPTTDTEPFPLTDAELKALEAKIYREGLR